MELAVARLRLAALDQAVKVVTAHESNAGDVVGLAQAMYEWLSAPEAPAHLALTVGEITHQDENKELDSVQIHDDEQFTLTVKATDAKGFDVTDPNLTWTVDQESVASLQVSADKQSAVVVAGVPGSAVITLTDGTLTVTEAVDVVPGGVALITLNEGTVSKQPPAAPATPVETPAPVETTPAAPADTTGQEQAPAPIETAFGNPAGDAAV